MIRRIMRAKTVIGSLISFGFAACLIWDSATFKGVPPRRELTAATGHVVSANRPRRHNQRIRFRLDDIAGTFQYSDVSEDLQRANAAISAARRDPITILYDAGERRRSPWVSGPLFEVHEVSTTKKMVRPWSDVSERWESSKRGRGWLGLALLGLGGFLAFVAVRFDELRKSSDIPTSWS